MHLAMLKVCWEFHFTFNSASFMEQTFYRSPPFSREIVFSLPKLGKLQKKKDEDKRK